MNLKSSGRLKQEEETDNSNFIRFSHTVGKLGNITPQDMRREGIRMKNGKGW